VGWFWVSQGNLVNRGGQEGMVEMVRTGDLGGLADFAVKRGCRGLVVRLELLVLLV
jgi:hypothetical protein